jgi:hypothetical protein
LTHHETLRASRRCGAGFTTAYGKPGTSFYYFMLTTWLKPHIRQPRLEMQWPSVRRADITHELLEVHRQSYTDRAHKTRQAMKATKIPKATAASLPAAIPAGGSKTTSNHPHVI